MAVNNLNELLNKSDGSPDSKGVLTADEWNFLVQEVINTQQASEGAIKGVNLNGQAYTEIDQNGHVVIKTSESQYYLSIKMIDTPPTIVSKGSPCKISFSIEHTYIKDETPAAVACTANIYCNDPQRPVYTVTDLYDRDYADNNVTKVVSFDLSTLGDSFSTRPEGNKVWIDVINGKGSTDESQTYTVKVIDMSIDTDYFNGPVFTNEEEPSIRITTYGTKSLIYGSIDNNMIIDGLDLKGATTYDIPSDLFEPYNTHGIHELKLWIALPDNKDIKVEAPIYRYIYGETSNQTPIIMSTLANNSEFVQYDNLSLNYVAYWANVVGVRPVNIYIKNESGQIVNTSNQNLNFIQNKSEGNTTMSLFTQNDDYEIYGDMFLDIALGHNDEDGSFVADYTDRTNIIIKPSPIPLYEIGGYDIYMSSTKPFHSNESPDKDVWVSMGKTQANMIFDPSIEFSSSGSGWNADDEGYIAMHLRRGKKIELDYKPFSTNPVFESDNNKGTGLGKTISIEFATRNCLKQDSSVISCIDPDSGVGFNIMANKAILKSSTANLKVDFKENSRIRIDFVIQGKNIHYEYTSAVGKGNPLKKGEDDESIMIIYVDGVYQRLAKIDPGTSFLQSTPQNIIFGSDDCDLDIYSIRVYDQFLSCDEIVKNYSWDTPNPADKKAIASRNDIFYAAATDKDTVMPKIDPQKLRDARPDLPFFYVMMEPNKTVPNDKDNWVKLVSSSWVNPNSTDNNRDGNASWETDNGSFKNQGTSSMGYPWPWRNFDYKAKSFSIPTLGSNSVEKWKPWGSINGDGISKITLKKDYASSEMCNNAICSELFTDMAIGIADLENGNYIEVLSPSMQKETPPIKNRLTFKAIPCFMFNTLNDGSNTQESLGMMNLIPNKNEVKYLGFTQNYWEDGEEYPREQSWEVAENHINWDFKIDTTFAENDPNAEQVDGVWGYYEDLPVPVLGEDGKPMVDENGDPVYEKDELGNVIKRKTFVSNFKNGIADNYEARYPKDSTIWADTDFGFEYEDATSIDKSEFDRLYDEQVDIINFHNWLVDTNRYCATGKRLDDDPNFIYEDWNIIPGTNEHRYEFDTQEYRKAKFTQEAPKKLLLDQWILYYIWRETFWMFDSGSKNLQIYTMDGERWGCMVRDADTALGVDNKGVDRFPAYLEDTDYYTEVNGEMIFHFDAAKDALSADEIPGNPVLNGQFGSIWLNLRDCFSNKISNMYRDLIDKSDKTYFSYIKSADRFDEHQSHWCENLYNFGMRQYFGGQPFSETITSGNGNKKHSRRNWLEKGFYYRNTKYATSGDLLNCRGTMYKTNDSRGNSVRVTTYTPMYISTGGSDPSETQQPNKFRVTYPDIGVDIPIQSGGFNLPNNSDQNLYIYGSNMITDLGDLARYVRFNMFKVGTGMEKLRFLRLGDHTNTYYRIDPNDNKSKLFYNESLTDLLCNGMPSLEYLDITRHEQLKNFNFDQCTQLKEFYASGTNSIANLRFPKTSTLETVHVGPSLKTLNMEDLTGIKSFDWDGMDNVESLIVKNCGEYMKSRTYELASACLPSLENSYKNNIYDIVCSLYDINWKNANQSILSRLVDIEADITGEINLGSLSYDNKIKFMSYWKKKYDIDINDPNNGIMYISTNNRVDIEGITMPSKVYMYTLGENQLSFNPKVNGNNFVKMEWSLTNTSFAKIDKDTGILTVLEVADESSPQYATATLKVYCDDGNIYEGSTEIHFYQRSCRLGDYVFNDGDYNDELIGGKDPIGICFYIDPDDPNSRLMVALDNVDNSSYFWGLQDKMWENDTSGYPDVKLPSNPDYDCYNISTIIDINTIGENKNYYDENGYYTTYDLFDPVNEYYRVGNSFKFHSIMTALGSLGFTEASNRISLNGEEIQKKDYIPTGREHTLNIIKHRNTILNEFAMDIPAASRSASELDNLKILLAQLGNNKDKYFYYSAASAAYAYQPTKIETELDDRFKAHKWFLPAPGDATRIRYYLSEFAHEKIFDKAIAEGKFKVPGYVTSSLECDKNQNWVVENNGWPSMTSKSNSSAVRPICQF